jgi:hypothetical protein
MTQITIKRPNGNTTTLRVPDGIDWVEVVDRCQREFGGPEQLGGPNLDASKAQGR